MFTARYVTFTASAIMLVLGALALAACGGAAGAPEPDQPELSGVLPPLSEIDDLVRSVSVDVELTKQGNEAFAQSAGAVESGSALELVTGNPSILEWAVYAYSLGDKAPRRFIPDISVNSGQYWLAVGNYATGLWEFNGPYDGDTLELLLIPPLDYKSPGKSACLAVIAASVGESDTDLAINSVTLVAAEGVSNQP